MKRNNIFLRQENNTHCQKPILIWNSNPIYEKIDQVIVTEKAKQNPLGETYIQRIVKTSLEDSISTNMV